MRRLRIRGPRRWRRRSIVGVTASPQPVADGRRRQPVSSAVTTGALRTARQRLVGRRRVVPHDAADSRGPPASPAAEAGLQQVGDLGQRGVRRRVCNSTTSADHTGAELCAGRPQRVGGLQGVAALDPPPTLRAVADLDVEAAHQRAHRGKVFLIAVPPRRSLRPRHAVRTPRRRRCRQGLVDVRRARAASLPAIARAGPPAGTAPATLRPLLGERSGLPAVPRGVPPPTAVSGARSRSARSF